jgi:hypothetical protein
MQEPAKAAWDLTRHERAIKPEDCQYGGKLEGLSGCASVVVAMTCRMGCDSAVPRRRHDSYDTAVSCDGWPCSSPGSQPEIDHHFDEASNVRGHATPKSCV